LPNTGYGNPSSNLNKLCFDEIKNNLTLGNPENPESFNLNNIGIAPSDIQIVKPVQNYIDISQAQVVYPMADAMPSNGTDSN
jgi:hypothetical protein